MGVALVVLLVSFAVDEPKVIYETVTTLMGRIAVLETGTENERILSIGDVQYPPFRIDSSKGMLPPKSLSTELRGMIGSFTMFSQLPETILVVGATNPELPVYLASILPNAAVDVVEETPEFLDILNEYFHFNATTVGNFRLLNDSIDTLPREGFYQLIFINRPCTQVSKDNLDVFIRYLSSDGAVVIRMNQTECLEATFTDAFQVSVAVSNGTKMRVYRHGYVFGDVEKPESHKNLVLSSGVGPYKFWSLFNRAKVISQICPVTFDLSSESIIPLDLEIRSNANSAIKMTVPLACTKRNVTETPSNVTETPSATEGVVPNSDEFDHHN
eukprot:c6356_g1_i1.p1 GENE.c6356_g1_i1~~c6356_g1_i1.p1  ORF type:complete len:329 (+),score=87.81 c6356_g1_i1:43-1029(+)